MPLSDITKGGWHPKGRDGGKESWRGDFKGINTIATALGKGRDSSAAEASRNHQSTPLSALKDPSVFAPPPKHIAYHGAIAAPNTTTPDKRGWGEPAKEVVPQQAQIAYQPQPEVEEEQPAPPPIPYRANTTGLSTANLPKPPVRQIIQSEEGHVPQAGRPPPTAIVVTSKPKPQPPPRLPPRQNSHPDGFSPSPPPVYSPPHETVPAQSDGYLNQGALNRLGQAGISVKGFDIGRTASPKANTSASTPPAIQQQTASAPANHMSNIQSRFSRMTTGASSPNSASSTPSATTSSGGTTWAQKQKALQTASNFHQNPSSISFADAKDAASTANNFRQRHGDQVASGWKTAQKYGVADKVGSAVNTMSSTGAQTSTSGMHTQAERPGMGSTQSSASTLASAAMAAAKKAPPPPPKKKNLIGATFDGHQGTTEELDLPPPIPLASKPR